MSLQADDRLDSALSGPTDDRPMTGWAGPVPASLAYRARALAEEVARRVSDPQRLVELAVLSADQAEHPMGWQYPGFAHGHAGVSLLHLAAARAAGDGPARERAERTAFDFIREAVAGTRIVPLEEPGLFAGTSGLALCMADCVAAEPRFGPSLDRLHRSLAEQVAEMHLPHVERGVSDSDYDLISGASGILGHLLTVDGPDAVMLAAIDRLVGYLVWLGGTPDDRTVPHRWMITPAQYSPHELMGPPAGGYLNLGVAHGVPGMAAALAAAIRTGHRAPGDTAALRRMTSWIAAGLRRDEFGPFWPSVVSVSERGGELDSEAVTDQLAWCYGTAGVSACLLAVADATDDTALRRTAVEAFEAVLRRARVVASSTPTLCHGRAGLLAICLEFAATGASPLAAQHLPLLLEEVVGFADDTRPLLFVDQEQPGVLVDSPAVLTGACGVALTLFAATAEHRPSWLRAFLTR